MENNLFKILLNDLYERYNPTNVTEIENIANNYIGQEFDAVYYFLTKYNYPKHPNYDPSLNDINNIKKLFREYVEGNRTLNKVSLKESLEEQIKKSTDSKIQSTTKQISVEVEKVSKDIKEEVENLKKELNKQIEKAIEINQSSQVTNIEYKLNILFNDIELEIPKEINNFSIGTRFLIKDQSGNMIALEIKDIFCDFISVKDGFIKEITIDKI